MGASSSFLYTDYAAQPAVIKPTFSKVISISLEERLFTGVGRKSVRSYCWLKVMDQQVARQRRSIMLLSAELSKLIRNFPNLA